MRLIDADELEAMVKRLIELTPTIDPVKHGRWEVVDSREPMRYGCSECKRMVWHPENYCPNCGAKMSEDEE